MKIDFYEELEIEKLELLGSGTQGKVYRTDFDRCIKVFKSRHICEDELKTLLMGQIDVHFPRLYSAGENYIIRECIDGIPLNKYLLEHPLTPFLSGKIIKLYESMKKVGYKRLDTAIFHVFVTPQNELKLIDTSKALKKNEISPLDCGWLEKVGI
jgi:RIO-like serine/threonine protein kinase